MSEFVFLFRGRKRPDSPQEMQRVLEKWSAWMNDLSASGRLKDRGQPLDDGGRVVRSKKLVNDGPFAEAKDLVNGYMLIEASDLAEAAQFAKGCPILDNGGTVEVRPVRTR